MALVVYPALVRGAEPGEIAATFPDFAGVAVHAGSPAELLLRARERLLEALQRLEQGGEAWPEPSTLAQARTAASGAGDEIVWVDVEVEETPVRVTISLGERLLARIDAAAEEHALTRSGYLAAAARRQMATGRSPLEAAPDSRLLEEVAAAGRRLHEMLGPQSPVGRTLAELDAVALDGLRRMAGALHTAPPTRRTPGDTPSDTAEERTARGEAARPDA